MDFPPGVDSTVNRPPVFSGIHRTVSQMQRFSQPKKYIFTTENREQRSGARAVIRPLPDLSSLTPDLRIFRGSVVYCFLLPAGSSLTVMSDYLGTNLRAFVRGAASLGANVLRFLWRCFLFAIVRSDFPLASARHADCFSVRGRLCDRPTHGFASSRWNQG